MCLLGMCGKEVERVYGVGDQDKRGVHDISGYQYAEVIVS